MSEHHTSREIAPFFRDAGNLVYTKPHKSLFCMPGPIRLGKTTNFLLLSGAYDVAQHVRPVKRGNRKVRESLWVLIRESENSAVETLKEAIGEAIFPPEVLALEDSPVQVKGSHPRFVHILHDLPDGTLLDMKIECYGFNNEQAESKLRSRAWLGALLPEVQGIPWLIVTTVMERCGTWHPNTCMVEKTINGKKYLLSGASDLKIVFADMNIPPRPHPVYDHLLDPQLPESSPYEVIYPPQPLQYRPIVEVPNAPQQYPRSNYEGKRVVWLPNPDAYYMTRHFERTDPDTNKRIPWTGYGPWLAKIGTATESEIRRLVLGLPDTKGGAAAVYRSFDKDMVQERPLLPGVKVLIGYDPGKHSSFVFLQEQPDGSIHQFHELIFHAEDGMKHREQIEDFLIPYCDTALQHHEHFVVPDPSAFVSNAAGEDPVAILRSLGQRVKPCLVPNQNTIDRIGRLDFFMGQGRYTIDPSCEATIEGLMGGYQYKKSRSGVISATIDKNLSSHVIESLQYPMVNYYFYLVLRKNRKSKGASGRVLKIRHRR